MSGSSRERLIQAARSGDLETVRDLSQSQDDVSSPDQVRSFHYPHQGFRWMSHPQSLSLVRSLLSFSSLFPFFLPVMLSCPVMLLCSVMSSMVEQLSSRRSSLDAIALWRFSLMHGRIRIKQWYDRTSQPFSSIGGFGRLCVRANLWTDEGCIVKMILSSPFFDAHPPLPPAPSRHHSLGWFHTTHCRGCARESRNREQPSAARCSGESPG